MLGEWGLGRETELGEGEAASGLRVVPAAPLSPPGAGGLLGWPRSPGILARGWRASGGLQEGAIHPLGPLRGEPVIHPGSEGWERPPSSAKTRCARGAVPQWEKRGGSGVFLGAVPQKA